jgi:DNA-binding NtrC family response regulator
MNGAFEDLILIVDDDPAVLTTLTAVLKANGLGQVLGCTDERQAMGLVADRQPGLILLDLGLPHIPGQRLLADIRLAFPQVPVVVVTARNEVQAAVDCMRAGAFDYMVKPVEESRLAGSVKRALDNRRLQGDCRRLKDKLLSAKLTNPRAFGHIVTQNRAMQAIFLIIEAVAPSAEPVLITGETGVGKELIALAVHRSSGRSGPYLAVNISGLDDPMFADALFGHRKGAFTGATEAREGMIQQAAGGTLLLDEIGDLSLASQVKLLRLLDTGEYLPVGSDLPKRSSARVVASTNRDLEALRAQGKFRNDLYYRLSTHCLNIPPLREHADDLPLLLSHWLREAAAELHKEVPPVPRGLLTLLSGYDFPGNIRELRKLVFDALARHSAGPLSLDSFRQSISKSAERPQSAAEDFVFPARLPGLRQVQTLLIEEALKRSGGNQSIAASLLGVSHQALSKRLKQKKTAAT